MDIKINEVDVIFNFNERLLLYSVNIDFKKYVYEIVYKCILII